MNRRAEAGRRGAAGAEAAAHEAYPRNTCDSKRVLKVGQFKIERRSARGAGAAIEPRSVLELTHDLRPSRGVAVAGSPPRRAARSLPRARARASPRTVPVRGRALA